MDFMGSQDTTSADSMLYKNPKEDLGRIPVGYGICIFTITF